MSFQLVEKPILKEQLLIEALSVSACGTASSPRGRAKLHNLFGEIYPF